MKMFVLALSAVLSACDGQMHPNTAAEPDAIASLSRRTSALEVRVAAIEQSEKMQQQAVGNWTLWQVSDEANAGYPQALSAYSSKNECLASTARWSFPGGKLVSSDPAIFQMKGYRVRLECLPAGTNPYAR